VKKILYLGGRTLQLAGLLILPSAIWVTEVEKSEWGALTIFFGGIVIFLVGLALVVIAGIKVKKWC